MMPDAEVVILEKWVLGSSVQLERSRPPIDLVWMGLNVWTDTNTHVFEVSPLPSLIFFFIFFNLLSTSKY